MFPFSLTRPVYPLLDLFSLSFSSPSLSISLNFFPTHTFPIYQSFPFPFSLLFPPCFPLPSLPLSFLISPLLSSRLPLSVFLPLLFHPNHSLIYPSFLFPFPVSIIIPYFLIPSLFPLPSIFPFLPFPSFPPLTF